MQGTNPTEFEKWCADEMVTTVEYIISFRRDSPFGGWSYMHMEISKLYRAYLAGRREISKSLTNGAQNAGN